jgi:hypothetical protein
VFQLFQMYVAIVSSRCCKSRSGVAYVSAVLGGRADKLAGEHKATRWSGKQADQADEQR